MIYKITFEDGRVDYCTAQSQLHLLKSYDSDFELNIQELESIEEVSEEEAKSILVRNTEYDDEDPEDDEHIALWELAVGDDFSIIASTEY